MSAKKGQIVNNTKELQKCSSKKTPLKLNIFRTLFVQLWAVPKYSLSEQTVLSCPALNSTALNCTTLHCTTLYCTTLYCTTLHCTTLYCTTETVIHYTALHYTAHHCTCAPGLPSVSPKVLPGRGQVGERGHGCVWTNT